MKGYIFIAALALTACSTKHTVEVSNPANLDRSEIASVDMADIRGLFDGKTFVITDSEGKEVPYQVTYDEKVIFPVTVKAGATARYTIEEGTPGAVDTIACGAFYPERKDDLAWENDRAAYRAYGPALQASDEHAYGYDIWTKSVSSPVVRRRYVEAFTIDKNFHEDHGDGMDAYTVGPTLGGGTAALIDSAGNIVYPWCFSSYEILDNGPLRFTVRLNYESGETRLITLDAGEYLNRTEVCFRSTPCKAVASGIVIHRQNPDGYVLSPEDGYMAYADLTDNADNGNGVIYVGVVAPGADSMLRQPLETPQGDAIGHILAKQAYTAGDCYVYYWGSGWSKGSMPDWPSWKQYLADFHTRLVNPLKITIK